ncbi:MAG: hypothetical protein IPJ20_24195 [Flammeovirgaceae bacterium]|nr:hypothetical protein [Flammeovirgaceae bacterium]
MRYINLILLLCVIASHCLGQVDQLARFELAVNENDENRNFNVTSLDQEGILIYHNLFADAQNLLELIRVDTSLTEIWRGYIAIQRNLRISHVKLNDQLVLSF